MGIPSISILKFLLYKNRRKITSNLYDLINYSTLAVLIGANGKLTKRGIVLKLNNYNLKNLIEISYIFEIKFNIKISILNTSNYYNLFIDINNLKKIYNKINLYLIPSIKEDIKNKYNI